MDFFVYSVHTLYWTLSNCISTMGTNAWTLVCAQVPTLSVCVVYLQLDYL